MFFANCWRRGQNLQEIVTYISLYTLYCMAAGRPLKSRQTKFSTVIALGSSMRILKLQNYYCNTVRVMHACMTSSLLPCDYICLWKKATFDELACIRLAAPNAPRRGGARAEQHEVVEKLYGFFALSFRLRKLPLSGTNKQLCEAH